MSETIIRPYRKDDEAEWLRCRVLAFLDSAYFDDVQTEKPRYDNPAIELVAEHPTGGLVGFIDVECEESPGTVCSNRPGLAGMIWNLGVHPDHRGRNLASRLFGRAAELSRQRGLARLEAWTRDDPGVLQWYRSHGFRLLDTYLHVYLDYEEAKETLTSRLEGIRPVKVFAHFTDTTRFDEVRSRFGRVHDCNLFELDLETWAEGQ